MLKKILMILIPLIALIGGAVGGDILKGKPEVDLAAEGTEGDADKDAAKAAAGEAGAAETAYFRFPTQFFVPIMQNGDTFATMIVALTLEMPKASEEKVLASEHRLRDALLRALMIHANTGGFSGNYTSDQQMDRLRASLLKAATDTAGPDVTGILVEDIARQMQ